jgi:enoyl-CoA hydratase/carnithine racemase
LVLAASDDPLTDAYACANDLVANCSPASMAVIKAQILRAMNASFNDSADDAFIEMGHAFNREDLAAALVGKLNKVAPQFPPNI